MPAWALLTLNVMLAAGAGMVALSNRGWRAWEDQHREHRTPLPPAPPHHVQADR